MKTRGVEVVCGFVVCPWGRGVPDAFWNRLKHEIQKRHLVDEYKAEYAQQREAVHAERSLDDAFRSEQTLAEADREQALFRRWVQRLGLTVERWPWQGGWTQELVDEYLVPATLEAA